MMQATIQTKADHNLKAISAILDQFAIEIQSELNRSDYFSITLEVQVQGGKVRLAKTSAERTQLFCNPPKDSL